MVHESFRGVRVGLGLLCGGHARRGEGRQAGRSIVRGWHEAAARESARTYLPRPYLRKSTRKTRKNNQFANY